MSTADIPPAQDVLDARLKKSLDEDLALVQYLNPRAGEDSMSLILGIEQEGDIEMSAWPRDDIYVTVSEVLHLTVALKPDQSAEMLASNASFMEDGAIASL